MTDTGDRRSEPRISALYLLAYTEAGEARTGTQVHIGRTLDLSEKGCQIETHTPLDEGQRLSLEIAVGNRIIGTIGETVHVEPRAGGLVAAGIRLIDIDDEDRERLRAALG